ncbi:MAG: homocysteine S-methyltransferase family protein [Clostridia bacterium]|nr:homocysteine S-methyltransferase family protein [Clostridia bacterium]
MNVKEYMKNHLLYLDGGMGTLLQAAGMAAGELPERRNLTHPENIVDIHRAYYDAGSNVVNTNTFGANTFKYEEDELQAVIRAAVSLARRAAAESSGVQEKFVALDIGPLGRLIKPYGTLDFEDAVEVFAKTVRIGVSCGVDMITIETMSDSLETKAALLATKENSDLPVFVSNAYGADGKLMTGADPMAMIAMLEGLGADAIGINCSLGPKQMQSVVRSYLEYASVPVLVKPNAGLPRVEGNTTYYDVTPAEFSEVMRDFVHNGARVVGGCCGTTPAHILALHDATKNDVPTPLVAPCGALISSYNHAVELGKSPVKLGTSLDPANAAVKAALSDADLDSLVDEAFEDVACGARILQLNVAQPGIDETVMLPAALRELQSVINVPIMICSSDPIALEKALRIYNGKAMVRLGDAAKLSALLGVVKKYGAVVLCPSQEMYDVCISEAAACGLNPADIVLADSTIEYLD